LGPQILMGGRPPNFGPTL